MMSSNTIPRPKDQGFKK